MILEVNEKIILKKIKGVSGFSNPASGDHLKIWLIHKDGVSSSHVQLKYNPSVSFTKDAMEFQSKFKAKFLDGYLAYFKLDSHTVMPVFYGLVTPAKGDFNVYSWVYWSEKGMLVPMVYGLVSEHE